MVGRNALTTNATLEVAATRQFVLSEHEDPNLAGTTTFEVVIEGDRMLFPARKGGQIVEGRVKVEPGVAALWAEVVQEAQANARRNAFDLKTLIDHTPNDSTTLVRNAVAQTVPDASEDVLQFPGQPADWFAFIPIGFE
jgi:hypothetical protein